MAIGCLTVFSASAAACPGIENGKLDAAGAALNMKGGQLRECFDRTIFAASPDEARYNLGGVYIETPDAGKARFVSTDGRLSMVDRQTADFALKMQKTVIIPRKAVNLIRKLLDGQDEAEVTLLTGKGCAYVHHGNITLTLRLIKGEFPDCRGVIPKNSKVTIAIERDAMLRAVRRAAIMWNERYHGVGVKLEDGELTLRSTSPEMGEATESLDCSPVKAGGTKIEIGFNASYLLQELDALPEGAKVELALIDDVSPGVMRAPEADENHTDVCDAMRL